MGCPEWHEPSVDDAEELFLAAHEIISRAEKVLWTDNDADFERAPIEENERIHDFRADSETAYDTDSSFGLLNVAEKTKTFSSFDNR